MGEGIGVIVVRPVAAATQGPPWGNWALIHGGCAITLAKQHANVFKMHDQEVKLPFSHGLTPRNACCSSCYDCHRDVRTANPEWDSKSCNTACQVTSLSPNSHQIMQFLSTYFDNKWVLRARREGSGMPEMTLGRLQVSQRETC